MRVLRVRGVNFQGYPSFDVWLADGASCIVGPNMSRKSTFGRAVAWSCCNQFPYPGLGRFTKNLVRPATRKGAEDSTNEPTVVETWLAVPRDIPSGDAPAVAGTLGPDATRSQWGAVRPNESVYIVRRTLDHSGHFSLTLSDAEGPYSWTDTKPDGEAQDLIYSLGKIPQGTPTERAELFMRLAWYGVGQDTSFFNAKGSERRRIMEAINPLSRLTKMEKDAGKLLKQQTKALEDHRREASILEGRLDAKSDELVSRLPADRLRDGPAAPLLRRRERVAGLSDAALRPSGGGESKMNLVDVARELASLAEDAVRQATADGLSESAILDAVKRKEDELTVLREAMSLVERMERLAVEVEEAESRFSAVGGDAALRQAALDIEQFTTSERDATALAAAIESSISALARAVSHADMAETERARRAAEVTSLDGLSVSASDALRDATSVLDELRHLGAAGTSSRSVSPLARDSRELASAIEYYRRTLAQAASSRGGADAVGMLRELAAKIPADASERIASLGQEAVRARSLLTDLRALDSRAQGVRREIAAKRDSLSLAEAAARETSTALTARQVEHEALSELRLAGDAVATRLSASLSALGIGLTAPSRASWASVDAAIGALGTAADELAAMAGSDSPQDLSSDTLLAIVDRATEAVATKLLETSSAQEALTGADASVTSARDHLRDAEKAEGDLRQSIQRYEASLARLSRGEVGEAMTCRECASPLSHTHLEVHLSQARSALVDASAAVAAAKGQLASSSEALGRVRMMTDLAVKEASGACDKLARLGATFAQLSLASSVDGALTLAAMKGLESARGASERSLSEVASIRQSVAAAVDEEKSIRRELARDLGLDLEADDAQIAASLSSLASGADAEARRLEAESRQLESALRDFAAFAEQIEAAATGLLQAAGGGAADEALLLVSRERSAAESALGAIETALASAKNDVARISAEVQAASASAHKMFGYAAPLAEVPGLLKQRIADLASARGAKERYLAEVQALADAAAKCAARSEAALSSASAGASALVDRGAVALRSLADSVNHDIAALRGKIERARAISDTRRLGAEVGDLGRQLAAIESLCTDLEGEVESLAVIKGILQPSGEARTLALTNDVATVVSLANRDLASLELSRQLAINLSTEPENGGPPTIELSFEVDGDSGGILPSESQRKIVGLVTDLAVSRLATRDAFIIIDEPETGLDNVNRGKLARYLKTASPQTIVVTNTASAGFDNIITTDQIAASGGSSVREELLGVAEGEAKPARKRPPRNGRKSSKKAVEASVDGATAPDMDSGEI